MITNKQIIEYKYFLNKLNYSSIVKRIEILRSKKDNINSDELFELIELDTEIRIFNARCKLLTDRELAALGYRYLVDKPYSYREIGILLNCSRSTAARLEAKVIEKLAHYHYESWLVKDNFFEDVLMREEA